MKRFIRSLLLCALSAILCALLSCGSASSGKTNVSTSADNLTHEEKEETTKPSNLKSDGLFYAVKNYAPKASVVYSERASADEIRLAESIASFIQQKTGVSPTVKSDYVANVEDVNTNDFEILVGLTNRPASIALNATLTSPTFAIECTESKLAIVGTNVGTLSLAVDYFKESFSQGDGITLKKGEFSLPCGTRYVNGKCQPLPKNLMNSGLIFDSELNAFTKIDAHGEMSVIGGVCCDGEFLYAVMRQGSIDLSTMSYKSVVAKYSLQTRELVSVSNEFDLGLGADMDYDPVSDRLVILHASAQGKETVSYMTTGLLNVTKSVNVSSKLSALCSDKNGGFFAVNEDGSELLMLDSNLSVTSRTSLRMISGDVSAITTDGLFIYVLTNAKTMLNVYATDGTYVNRVQLDTPLEAKGILVISDRLYVGFCDALWSEGEIYELTLSLQK